ncbi:hypothetical protein D5086_017215 [Populus alba]|uniref:Uncharacterized protein n=1 Tax=Populus alba TaxID=43335 RepID=A0ACC4BW44_POPAL
MDVRNPCAALPEKKVLECRQMTETSSEEETPRLRGTGAAIYVQGITWCVDNDWLMRGRIYKRMHVNGGQMGSIKKSNISRQNGIFHFPVGGGASGTEFKIKVELFP